MAVQSATAVFNSSQDSVAVTWTVPFASTPAVMVGIGVTDGSVLDAGVTGVSTTGCTVVVTGRFNGEVPLSAAD